LKNSTTFRTGNVRDNCYPHIRLFPTHPHIASLDFICLLPVTTSAHPLITNSLVQWLSVPMAFCSVAFILSGIPMKHDQSIQITTVKSMKFIYSKTMYNISIWSKMQQF